MKDTAVWMGACGEQKKLLSEVRKSRNVVLLCGMHIPLLVYDACPEVAALGWYHGLGITISLGMSTCF